MSDAKKCDRCGAEVDEINMTLASDVGYEGAIDLCEKCAESFDNWLWRLDDE